MPRYGASAAAARFHGEQRRLPIRARPEPQFLVGQVGQAGAAQHPRSGDAQLGRRGCPRGHGLARGQCHAGQKFGRPWPSRSRSSPRSAAAARAPAPRSNSLPWPSSPARSTGALRQNPSPLPPAFPENTALPRPEPRRGSFATARAAGIPHRSGARNRRGRRPSSAIGRPADRRGSFRKPPGRAAGRSAAGCVTQLRPAAASNAFSRQRDFGYCPVSRSSAALAGVSSPARWAHSAT